VEQVQEMVVWEHIPLFQVLTLHTQVAVVVLHNLVLRQLVV
jgi:hypothetical protein